jgi:hypothetical protein
MRMPVQWRVILGPTSQRSTHTSAVQFATSTTGRQLSNTVRAALGIPTAPRRAYAASHSAGSRTASTRIVRQRQYSSACIDEGLAWSNRRGCSTVAGRVGRWAADAVHTVCWMLGGCPLGFRGWGELGGCQVYNLNP